MFFHYFCYRKREYILSFWPVRSMMGLYFINHFCHMAEQGGIFHARF